MQISSPLRISLPLNAPSVNHYVKHTRSGRHYVTGEAKAFMSALAVCAKGRKVRAKSYGVAIFHCLGKGVRLDIDNGQKCVLDGLVAAGVIHSDAAVTELHVYKTRMADDPQTVIVVEAL